MKKIIFVVALISYIYANELTTLISKSKKGDIKSIFKLAYIYENGINVVKNENKAYKLYKKAAQMGDKDALIALSLLELKKDYKPSNKNIKNKVTIKDNSSFLELSEDEIKDLIIKSKRRDKDAIFILATLYENGFNNIKANKKRAILLYKKAKELGSKKAKSILLTIEN